MIFCDSNDVVFKPITLIAHSANTPLVVQDKGLKYPPPFLVLSLKGMSNCKGVSKIVHATALVATLFDTYSWQRGLSMQSVFIQSSGSKRK